jgi:hypothetical protein
MTVISPQDFVRLHGGINGWRPDQAAIDAYIAINSGALPLADYQQQLAAMADAQYHGSIQIGDEIGASKLVGVTDKYSRLVDPP